MLQQYYEILVKDNDFGVVYKIDYETYKRYENTFDNVYHTKKGYAFKMACDHEKGIDILIVDDNHLHELLDDLKEEGFCDPDNLWLKTRTFCGLIINLFREVIG